MSDQPKNLQTVTVALSAYNEESNILAFLHSIVNQETDGFMIEKIVLVSDGSDDGTVAKAKSLDNPKIEIIEHAQRAGKSSRLNEIYSQVNSDILVQSDADVVLAHKYVIRDLIRPIVTNPQVGMSGGRPLPLQATTFTEKAINLTAHVYDEFRSTIRGGNNIFSADGRLLAFKKQVYKKLEIPSDMIANDIFVYFSCLQMGFEYRYAETAVVHFRSPQTLKDQIRQNTRFVSAHARMARYFGAEKVAREFHIDPSVFWGRLFVNFLRHPIMAGYIFLVNLYCRMKSTTAEKQMTAKWQMAETTKNLE